MRKTLLVLLVFFLLSPIYCKLHSTQVYLDLINEISLASEPKDIVLYDNAYIISGGMIYSATINDPYNISVTEIPELSGSKSIAFIGHYCYALAANGDINIYDMAKSPIAKKTTINSTGRVRKIVIDNGYLYAINEDAGMQVYDVNIADFPIFKNTQIIPFNSVGIFIANYKAYVTSSSGSLSIIDVSDKSKLSIVGSYNSGTTFYEPFVDGNYAYVPQGSSGVQVLDITKLPTPEWLVNLFGRKNSHQVVASNFYVWVADDKSIEGFFTSGPKTYTFAGNHKFTEKINRIALIDGKYIYVCSTDKKLKILKITYKY